MTGRDTCLQSGKSSVTTRSQKVWAVTPKRCNWIHGLIYFECRWSHYLGPGEPQRCPLERRSLSGYLQAENEYSGWESGLSEDFTYESQLLKAIVSSEAFRVSTHYSQRITAHSARCGYHCSGHIQRRVGRRTLFVRRYLWVSAAVCLGSEKGLNFKTLPGMIAILKDLTVTIHIPGRQPPFQS